MDDRVGRRRHSARAEAGEPDGEFRSERHLFGHPDGDRSVGRQGVGVGGHHRRQHAASRHVDVKSANRSFFTPGAPITYAVQVADREDGTIGAGTIAAEQVAFSIDYVPEGFDLAKLRHGQAKADATTRFAVAKA